MDFRTATAFSFCSAMAMAGTLVLTSANPAAAEDHHVKRTVTVSATGEVSAVPDIARVSAGVLTEHSSAKEALEDNSQTMSGLIKELKAGGIDAEDIQTSNFSVSPRYTRPERGGVARIDGYQVRNQVDVTVRKLSELGELLDLLIKRGANSITGPTFEVSKRETIKDQARETAMKNARRRAGLLAAAAGAEVDEVVTISEDVHGGGPVRDPLARTAMAEAVPIEAGSETLQVRVTVTWKLK